MTEEETDEVAKTNCVLSLLLPAIIEHSTFTVSTPVEPSVGGDCEPDWFTTNFAQPKLGHAKTWAC
jgi:hypothetical protein